ncbi:amino acid permease [Corynebacterium sp. ES2730-CONJ]|uniref:amino acid permease n=1 Tax=Corynebacterium sp. ES2730-CONJ TaxID=2973941 RepID=UPI00216ADB88|nr:amino acid permease [Corynebacterium sp. ES2730-CONJ]MCS4531784.1 amino acid permease [Corynebacterium sp. ES2730-CONJ]
MNTSEQRQPNTVRLWALVAIIVGSTVGSGIFALPQNIASVAGPGAMLIGWIIAGIGMLSVAFVFHILAYRKPHLDSGVYAYVRAGLGNYIGFTSGWGYWLGSVIAQVGYATLFFGTLGHYFPVFSSDNRLFQAICVSAMTWIVFAVLARGIQQAKIMNGVTTVAKLLPILAFIILVLFLGFSWDTFTVDFWGHAAAGSVFEQVQGIMLFTVWVFIGVEGASVYSKQAHSRADVGRATVIGFFTVLLLLVTVATLSFGVLSQEELAALPDNSMAGVLEAVVGPWGGALISIGLCLSVLGAYISWQMLCAEPLAMMAYDSLLPRKIGSLTNQGAPWLAQLICTAVIQICIIVFYLNETTYIFMVQLATVLYLVPYIFSSFYLILLAVRGRGFSEDDLAPSIGYDTVQISAQLNRRHLGVGILALTYSLWLVYAADPVFVLFGALAVLPGLIPYIWTRWHYRKKIFNSFEIGVVGILVIFSIAAIIGLYTGSLSL